MGSRDFLEKNRRLPGNKRDNPRSIRDGITKNIVFSSVTITMLGLVDLFFVII